MIKNTFSRSKVERFYDLVGGFYEWFSIFEARAKNFAIECLELSPGMKLLNVGMGTGNEQKGFKRQVTPGGLVIGIDISLKMLSLSAVHSWGELCRADGGDLPFASRSFDRLYCAYVLDLVPLADIPVWLAGFRRVLRRDGRMVIVSLTEGIDYPSKAIVSLWKAAYSINPALIGGCCPLHLRELVRKAGFDHVDCNSIVQLGLPSEVVVAS